MSLPEAMYLQHVLGVGDWLEPVAKGAVAASAPRCSVVVFEELSPARRELIQKMFAAINCLDFEIIEGDVSQAQAAHLFHFGEIPEHLKSDERWVCGAPSLHELCDEEDPQILKLKKKTAWGALQHLERRLKV